MMCLAPSARQTPPSPRLRGEGWGEGHLLLARAPHPNSLRSFDLSPPCGERCSERAASHMRLPRVKPGVKPPYDVRPRSTASAARLPERIAPSMVAGRPVAVQSPASARLCHRVAAPGRLAFCSGVAAKV